MDKAYSSRPGKRRWLRRRWLRLAGLAVVCSLALGRAVATPPEYKSFERAQKADYTPEPEDLLRIWMIYVEQGDGLLIQLPPKFNYDPDKSDNDTTRSERIDVLIDGGAMPKSEAWRAADFIRAIYPGADPIIEHAVITHHDLDHVAGLTYLLMDDIPCVNIYHNGLASYRAGTRNFPKTTRPPDAIFKYRADRLRRGMAFLEPGTHRMKSEYLIENLDDLRTEFDAEHLQGVYEDLAEAVLGADVTTFQRVHEDSDFISEAERNQRVELAQMEWNLLWPLNPTRKYGDWGETINGNSVTFRLKYRDFEMLFTGDQNEKSEEALLEHLETEGRLDLLSCDVLKVPHHGSAHAYEAFFKNARLDPVVSVCSMGETGFRSKRLSRSAWQHPDTNVISWLGGSHRVYHTLIHERRFRWQDLDTREKHEAMYEYSHILIETDGVWFRIVEMPDTGDLTSPPTVQQTRRGNGTRWIRAKK